MAPFWAKPPNFTGDSSMQTAKTKIAAAVAAVLVSTCFVSQAYAGCSPFEAVPAAPGTPAPAAPQAPALHGFQGASFVQAAAKATLVHDNGFDLPWDNVAPIVGLWKIQFIVDDGTPAGMVIDDGYATWHADGTELMNSGRPPITSSFCMGAWKQTGPATFSLNHYALSWDATGTQFIGPTNIRETVTVDRRGKTYSGQFTITQYMPDGKTPAGGVSGKVKGTRIEP
jgi:hypothetical protein